jgi:hypothetical protein
VFVGVGAYTGVTCENCGGITGTGDPLKGAAPIEGVGDCGIGGTGPKAPAVVPSIIVLFLSVCFYHVTTVQITGYITIRIYFRTGNFLLISGGG